MRLPLDINIYILLLDAGNTFTLDKRIILLINYIKYIIIIVTITLTYFIHHHNIMFKFNKPVIIYV